MHSTIIRFVEGGKSARKMDMEEIYEGGCPSYADYTDELPSEQYAEFARWIAQWFPFCTALSGDLSWRIAIDHDGAKAALRARYKHASRMYAELAKSENSTDRLAAYEAKAEGAGDTYGVHFIYDYDDMNDLEFIRFCASDDAPTVLCIAQAWDYHC